jgi:hypothetical protein
MNKKIYALTLALMLVFSMNVFAGQDSKSCNRPDDAKQCDLKDKKECCKDAAKCDKESHEKCEKKKSA